MQTATLIIGDWNTTCSNCGGNADPSAAYHTKGGLEPGGNSYAPDGSYLSDYNGCGAKFIGRQPAPDARQYVIDGKLVPAYEVHGI